MKIKSIYNLASVTRFCDSGSKKGFQDAEAGVILARSLTAVDPKVFEKKYPELTFVNSGVQVDNTGGYSRRIQSLRLEALGGFSTAGDASANKGKISLRGEDSYLPVVEREAHSVWSDSEIKEAELQGINLPQRYLQNHNAIYLREIDEIGLVGHTDGPSEGLLNNSLFTTTAAADAAENLTAQEMYDELASLIVDQHNDVNNTPDYMATAVMMPNRVMNRLRVTMLNTAAGSSTVLKALQDNFPGIKLASTFRADTAANGGNLTASATVAYSTSDEVMKMRVPQPLTIGEVVKPSSFDFTVDSKYRVAGLDILEAAGGRVLTGL